MILLLLNRVVDSDIISLDVLGKAVIVLNSVASVDALLEAKSAIYSDRPSFTMLNDLVGFDWHFVFMRYGAKWKNHRKVFVRRFQPSNGLLHHPTKLNAARVLLQRLLESPAKFERHLRDMAGMVVLSTAYGIDVQPEKDPYVQTAEKAQIAIACSASRSAYLVDSFPFLKWVPDFFLGAGFKEKARTRMA
ncbi:cytochrome P450 [Mycena maculata]|uniref:Cytochrome P450 n=1 Tax=Mycena maculata TaxID=230809 RepID=A0AAD7KCU7_9AGAR|nr:cytochrome P450 [Mycena maculata]